MAIERIKPSANPPKTTEMLGKLKEKVDKRLPKASEKLDGLMKLVTGNQLFKWFEKLFSSEKTKDKVGGFMGTLNGILDWLSGPPKKAAAVQAKPAEAPAPAAPAAESTHSAPESEHETEPSDITTDLIDQATQLSARRLNVETTKDLEQLNPPLAQVIDRVCAEVGVHPGLIRTTFRIESNFEHGVVGDLHLDNASHGIGQFQPGTWKRITRMPAYREVIEKYYPGKTFKPGENLLADTVASAVYLRHIAERVGIDPTKKLSEREFVAVRCGYNAGEGNVSRVVARYDELQAHPESQSPSYTDTLINGYIKSFGYYRKLV